MLNARNAVKSSLILAVVLAVGLPMRSHSAPAGVGKITYTKGKVEAFRGGAWTKLAKESKVLALDTIRTSKKSRVEIVLVDKSIIRLGSRSKVKLTKALYAGNTTKEFSAKPLRFLP